MADWKSALKELKKDLQSAKDAGTQSKGEAKSKISLPGGHPAHRRPASRSFAPSLAVQVPNDRSAGSTNSTARIQGQTPRSPEMNALASRPTTPSTDQRTLAQAPTAIPKPQKPRAVPSAFELHARSRLTRQASFKSPDSWVSEGGRTQLSINQHSGSVIDVFIGLDFGTSYTKAAVGLKDQIFVVDWQGVTTGADRYLLPSEFSIMADGSCLFGQAPDVPFDRVRQRLKHPLIDVAVSDASLADAAVFVAMVLRYIRAWVFLHHGEKIGKSSIRWMLNIGAPSNGLENERHRRAYLKMGSSAWSMSLSEARVCPSCASDLIKSWQPDVLPQDLIGLAVLPEFVAQIAGYVQSSQRQRGLHALVDVGGGTLDVVTFIVHERDGEDVFPFLVPEIKPLGTQMLYENRLVEAPVHEESKLPDELQPVLSSSEYAKCAGIPEHHVELRDKVFWAEVHSTVHRVLHQTRKNRYRLSDAWSQGLPVFLTGGGGSVEGYIRSVRSGGQHCARVMNLMSLPKHPRLSEFAGSVSDYQRLSVACGLAQDAFSLGQLVPAGQVEDDIPAVSRIADRPDRDELYAR